MVTMKDLVNRTWYFHSGIFFYKMTLLNVIGFTSNMLSSGATDGAFMWLNFSTENKNFDKTQIIVKICTKGPSCKNGPTEFRGT